MAAGFKTATVASGDVPATQTNFPSYVDLSRLGITTLAEAQSVRVYADSGKTTEWAREIVSATEMHVKIPSLTSTTEIYVEWDGVSADYAVTDTYGRNAVWSDYRVVSHGGTTDSAGNVTITRGGTVADDTTNTKIGAIADNWPSKSVSNAITFGSISGRTVSFWLRRTTSGGNGYAVDARTGLTNGYNYLDDASLTINFGWTSVYKDGSAISSGASFVNNTWTHLVHKASAGWTDDIVIGNRYTGRVTNDSQYGQIDEIRITKTADLSANWITTEYNNQSDEAGFWGTWSDVGGATDTTKFFAMMH